MGRVKQGFDEGLKIGQELVNVQEGASRRVRGSFGLSFATDGGFKASKEIVGDPWIQVLDVLEDGRDGIEEGKAFCSAVQEERTFDPGELDGVGNDSATLDSSVAILVEGASFGDGLGVIIGGCLSSPWKVDVSKGRQGKRARIRWQNLTSSGEGVNTAPHKGKIDEHGGDEFREEVAALEE